MFYCVTAKSHTTQTPTPLLRARYRFTVICHHCFFHIYATGCLLTAQYLGVINHYFDHNRLTKIVQIYIYILKIWYERKSRMKPDKEPHAAEEPWVGQACIRLIKLSLITEGSSGNHSSHCYSQYCCECAQKHILVVTCLLLVCCWNWVSFRYQWLL